MASAREIKYSLKLPTAFLASFIKLLCSLKMREKAKIVPIIATINKAVTMPV